MIFQHQQMRMMNQVQRHWRDALIAVPDVEPPNQVSSRLRQDHVVDCISEMIDLDAKGGDVREGMLTCDVVRPPCALPLIPLGAEKWQSRKVILNRRLDLIEQLCWPMFHDYLFAVLYSKLGEFHVGQGDSASDEKELLARMDLIRRKIEAKFPTIAENPLAAY